MTFMEATIQQNLDLWNDCFEHPFVKALRKHEMEDTMFLHYLKEDTKYLREYARVFGMAIFKSSSMENICLFFDMLKFVESCESATRVKLLQKAGYAIEDIEQQPMEKATQAYAAFLIQTAQEEAPISILFATLPCMLSYAYIGKRLMEENPRLIEESCYGSWIQEYVCEEYLQKCRAWIQAADQMSMRVSDTTRKHLQKLFHMASQHELCFWNMSYQKKG